MKKYLKFLIIVICFVLVYKVISYSASGAPAEFGNASLTTCYVGGDTGIINCTGNITTTSGVFVGDGSGITGLASIVGNCSAEGSCGLVTYNSDVANYSLVWSFNTSWIYLSAPHTNRSDADISDVMQNYSIIRSNNGTLGNTTLEIEAVCYANVTNGEWITPSFVIDIDDEDIETDLNTYIDVGGDEFTENSVLNMSGNITHIECLLFESGGKICSGT